ncbi:Nif11 family protein [Synechococcus sp. CS-1328]|uniref:Nif11 family protein n=1 Tax=Synechococcus sp. CS-1328 TaxID=2847976 RepID=UPI00223B231E|nr:Nif11 family protein [Synechococcus sp. CS-1328]MCT0226075.1 Nif11 family protein [Synechococcus sp. CS-1328]
MSMQNLHRLVVDAESDGRMRARLRRCRNTDDLIRTARRLGYGISAVDLSRARQDDQRSRQVVARLVATGSVGSHQA